MKKLNNLNRLEQVIINTLKIKHFDVDTLKNIFIKLTQINAKLYFYDSLTASPNVISEPIYDPHNDYGRNLIASGNPTFLNQEVLKYISASSITLSQISTTGLYINSCFVNDSEYLICDDEGMWGESEIINIGSLMIDQKSTTALKDKWLGAGRNNKIKDRILTAEQFFNHKRTGLKLGQNVSNQDVYRALHCPTKSELWNRLSDFSNDKLFPKLGKHQDVPKAINAIRDALDIRFELGTDKGREKKLGDESI